MSETQCFRQSYLAYEQHRTIDAAEYVRQLVIHYESVKHEDDLPESKSFLGSDRFAESIRGIVLDESFVPLADANSIRVLFTCAFNDDVSGMEQVLAACNPAIPTSHHAQPLLCIGLRLANAAIIQLSLDGGADITQYKNYASITSDLVRSGRDNPDVLDVLYKADFENWRTDPRKLNYAKNDLIRMGPACTQWWLSHGGGSSTESARGWMSSCYARGYRAGSILVGASTIRVLLDHFGIGWFRNSGVLQFAAETHNCDIVTMLLDAGADINEDVESHSYDIREYPFAPGHALWKVMLGKEDRDMAKFLIEKGATVSREKIVDHLRWLRAENGRAEFEAMVQFVEKLGAVTEEGQTIED